MSSHWAFTFKGFNMDDAALSSAYSFGSHFFAGLRIKLANSCTSSGSSIRSLQRSRRLGRPLGTRHKTCHNVTGQLTAHSEDVIECIHSTGQEITEDRNDVPYAFSVDESGTADKTRDIT